MIRGVDEMLARRPRIRALFHVLQPNRPFGNCATPALAASQGAGGLPRQRCRAVPQMLRLLVPRLLPMGSGTVRVANAGFAVDAGDVDTLQPAAADLYSPPFVLGWWRVSRATLPALAVSSLGVPLAIRPERVVQTMARVAWPAPQLDLGLEQRWALPGAPGAATPSAPDAGLLVGPRSAARSRVHLTWQAPRGRPDSPYGEVQARQVRVASAPLPQEPYADLRRGLLTKVELSGQTALALRPRGGRFGALLTSY